MFTSFFDGVKNFFTANVDETANGAEDLEKTNILVDKKMDIDNNEDNKVQGYDEDNEEQGYYENNEEQGNDDNNKKHGNEEMNYNAPVVTEINTDSDTAVRNSKRSRDEEGKASIDKRPRLDNTEQNFSENSEQNFIITPFEDRSILVPPSSNSFFSNNITQSKNLIPRTINPPSNNSQIFVIEPNITKKLNNTFTPNVSGKKRKPPPRSVTIDDSHGFLANTETIIRNANNSRNVSKKISNESITAQPIATISARLDQLDQIKSIVDTQNEIVVVPANSFTTDSLSNISASLQQLETTKILLSEIENIGTSQSKKRVKHADDTGEGKKTKKKKKSEGKKDVRPVRKDEGKPEQATKPLQETGKWLRLLYETTIAVGKKKEQEILENEHTRRFPVVSETTAIGEIAQSLGLLDKSANLFWQIMNVLFDSFFTVTDAPRAGLIGRIQNLQILCDKILKMLPDPQNYNRRENKKELVLLRELCGDFSEDDLVYNIAQVFLANENDRANINYLPTFLIDNKKFCEQIKILKNNVEKSKDENNKNFNKLIFNDFLIKNLDKKIFKIDKLINLQNNFLKNESQSEIEKDSFIAKTDLLRSKLVKKIDQKCNEMGKKCFNKKLRDIIENFEKIEGKFEDNFYSDLEDNKIKINKKYITKFEKNAEKKVFFFCTKGSDGYRQEDEFVTLVEQDASKVELNRQNYYMAVNYAHYWLTYFKIAFRLYRVNDLYAERYEKKIDFIDFIVKFSIN